MAKLTMMIERVEGCSWTGYDVLQLLRQVRAKEAFEESDRKGHFLFVVFSNKLTGKYCVKGLEYITKLDKL